MNHRKHCFDSVHTARSTPHQLHTACHLTASKSAQSRCAPITSQARTSGIGALTCCLSWITAVSRRAVMLKALKRACKTSSWLLTIGLQTCRWKAGDGIWSTSVCNRRAGAERLEKSRRTGHGAAGRRSRSSPWDQQGRVHHVRLSGNFKTNVNGASVSQA